MPRDVHPLDQWIEKHPRLAFVYTIGICVLICELAFILRELGKPVQP